jgi:hypothetical protein
MKRILLSSIAVALAVLALMQAPAPLAGLGGYIPPGPLLVLEARDFAGLLRDWNASPEKTAWLASDNHEVFSRSRLYLRLADAHAEFAAAAGLPATMELVDSVAGGESALALYDIGNLQFLYITRLASARALETALWKTRSSYETRNAAGFDYFVRTDPASRRVAAFAAAKDCLLLATREDLIAGALTLMAGRPAEAVTGERWYAESARAGGAPGDLRLVMNLTALVRSPYFRSYWIQRNVTEIRQFGAAIADLHRTGGQVREDRVLLRLDRPENATDRTSPAIAGALRLVPEGVGLYRAWAQPAPAEAAKLVHEKVVAPGPAAAPRSLIAPEAVAGGIAGSESDLETRIDEPPLDTSGAAALPNAVRALVEAASLESMLEVASSRTGPGGVFVGIDTAVVLVASSEWDAAAVRNAFARAPENGPLGRLVAEPHGRVLILANSKELAGRIVARLEAPPASPPATYAAEFRHAAESARFVQMMRLIDHAASGPQPEEGEREPRFFSDNLGSLSATLARIESSSIVVRDTGPAVLETVTYRLSK